MARLTFVAPLLPGCPRPSRIIRVSSQFSMRKLRNLVTTVIVTLFMLKLLFLTTEVSTVNMKRSVCNYVRSSYLGEVYKNNQPQCNYTLPETPDFLTVNSDIPEWKDLEARFTTVQPGGWFRPRHCQPKHKLAIIIPYRDREHHLKLFLQHMHPYLQTQELEYTIYVVELEKDVPFQKGLIMNAGFREIIDIDDSTCFAFHDVDMLPLSTGIDHVCSPKTVIHPSVYIKQYNFSKPYGRYMGGVLIFHKELYNLVNGFSNLYWGWGGEDDDMHFRLNSFGIKVVEPASNKHRYMSWSHDHQEEFKNRKQFIMTAVDRMSDEGLNSAKYEVVKKELRPLYTWLLVASKHKDASYKHLKAVHGTYDWVIGKKM